jgi:hypothetical protein
MLGILYIYARLILIEALLIKLLQMQARTLQATGFIKMQV